MATFTISGRLCCFTNKLITYFHQILDATFPTTIPLSSEYFKPTPDYFDRMGLCSPISMSLTPIRNGNVHNTTNKFVVIWNYYL